MGVTSYYMITVCLTTANLLNSGYYLTTQMCSVLMDAQVTCAEDAIQTSSVWQLALPNVWSVQIPLAGLMLVLLLIICNLTVSMGTINGLIFYANIVWVNNASFFLRPQDVRSESIPASTWSFHSMAEPWSWHRNLAYTKWRLSCWTSCSSLYKHLHLLPSHASLPITQLCLKSRKLHLYFRQCHIEGGDGREREAVVGSMESAVDAPPKCPPTVTMIELREPLLTDN